MHKMKEAAIEEDDEASKPPDIFRLVYFDSDILGRVMYQIPVIRKKDQREWVLKVSEQFIIVDSGRSMGVVSIDLLLLFYYDYEGDLIAFGNAETKLMEVFYLSQNNKKYNSMRLEEGSKN